MKINLVCLVALALAGLCVARGQEAARPKLVLDTEGDLRSVAFSLDGKLVATTNGTKTTVSVWDAETGKSVAKLSTGKDPANYVGKSNYGLVMPRVGFMDLRFSPDGSLLAVVSQVSNDVRLWDVRTGKLYTTLTGLKDMTSFEFSPDGKLLALGLGMQGLKLFDVSAGQLLTTRWDLKHVTDVGGASFSGDGKTLVVGISSTKEGESGFYIIEVATGKMLGAVLIPASRELFGNVSPDRRSFGTFEKGSGEIKVWDLATAQLKNRVAVGKAKLSQLALSYDGKTVAALTKDGSVQLWDVETSAPKGELQRQDSQLKYVAFLPGDNALLSLDSKGLKIWDAQTGTLAQSLDDARAPVDYSEQGKLLVAATKKGAAQVWEILR